MTRVKICGITNLEDALAAAEAGADALGFVFYQPSPRNIEVETAKAILAELPPFVTTVGLFVNADCSFLETVLSRLPLDLLQFHGDESEADCKRWGKPYIKAIRMQEGLDLVELCRTYHSSRGILLDTFVAGQPGGTGKVFDWQSIPQGLSKPIVLAGGLDPSNIAAAIHQVKPWAVDVSGGVEAAKGKKDHALIKAFITGVHSVSERA
ncbi:MAG: phosphoribosylanthranilate isomerase [Pseudomonadales bacterium]|nr:phosphoribosylanthranilate isomerase [Pseudomonadales bacterium]RLU02236.1 MAG: phosphoribosylanthranilate isomerase [Ketobacter sp.]